MRVGIIQFPGSNSDLDALKALRPFSDQVSLHWHEDSLEKARYDLIILPGGFSFGDYLRAGSLAKCSNAVKNLEQVVEAGAHVLGICNGFQILLEMQLLPGVLIMNESRLFISRVEEIEITEEAFPWFRASDVGRRLKLPIAHRYGNYRITPVNRKEVRSPIQYAENPNGSVEAIAGVYRSLGAGSVFGLMPHPERASFEAIGLQDGSLFWKNATQAFRERAAS